MKTIANIFILLSFSGMLSAQHTLQSALNLPRVGDEIIKQQVEYKDPGRSGANVIWNFSQLKYINDEYSLVYSAPELIGDTIYIMGQDTIAAAELSDDYLFIGTEHNTMYYYRLSGDTLWTLGHENAVTLLQYTPPLLTNVFPVNYTDAHTAGYTANGMYSMTVPFETVGNASLKADAYGMMILPSGDTLRHVIRTQSVRRFSEVLPVADGDSIRLNTRQENVQWYSNGYRYPLFETIRSIVRQDSTEINRFATAFFYPPQEQYYLGDEANLAVLDSLENANADPWAGLTYNIFPNPVRTAPLNIELYLPQPATVYVQVRNTMGTLLLDKNQGSHPMGICNFQLDLGKLPTNNYILDIWLNEHLISYTIQKR
jgi:hypothetical protein